MRRPMPSSIRASACSPLQRLQAAFRLASDAWRRSDLRSSPSPSSSSSASQTPWLIDPPPDWLDTEALTALMLTLPGADGRPAQWQVAVRDGIPLRAVPPQWRWPGLSEPVPLVRVRAPRARAQSLAPELRPCARPGMVGTATAVMRSADGGQSRLLTCAHVAIPSMEGAFGAEVDITHADAVGRATVMDWRPAPSAGPAHCTMDAAVLAIDDGLARDLRRDGAWLPTGVGGPPLADMAVTLRSHRYIQPGVLKVFWSGPVDVPGLTPGQTDYFLDQAIGYCCASRGGDSGSAIWDAQDRLMGMHLAGLDGVPAGEPNAIYGPIAPVLDTFKLRPWLRSGEVAQVDVAGASTVVTRGTTGGATRTGSAPSAGGALSEAEIVACTLWGEARNQGEEGLRAVACVIANRWRTVYRRQRSAQDVCLDPYQFSCWLKNDPNLPRMLAVARQPDATYRTALALADELLSRTLVDITRGARHYYATSLRQPPNWARGKYPCVVIGDHLFFNDIA